METFTGDLILNIWVLDICMTGSEAGLILQAVESKRKMGCNMIDGLNKKLLFATECKGK